MSKSTKPTQSDILHTQTNADENQLNVNSNSELIQKIQLDGTPFFAVGNQEQGYFLALGRFKLSDRMQTVQDIEQHIQYEFYNVILRMITAVSESINDIKKTDNKN